MNQAIKKRIEDINNGIVPEGYKQTPFGIFPCDWEKLELLDVCSCITKGTTPKVFTENGVRFVKVESIKDVYVENEWCSYIDQGTHQGFLARSILKKDDILFTIAGATIGKCAIIQECNLPANTNQALSIIRLRDKQLKWYVLSQLRGISMRRYVKDCIAVGAQPNISLEQMGKFSFYCSNKNKENIKIAEILMKWDEMVELQEQYIQKLELRKKTIMKKLLSPKDGWENKKLGDVCKIKTGKLDANAMVENGEYPFFTCSKEIFSIDKYSFDCEALLMAGNGDIGDIKYYNGKFDAYQRTYVLSDFSFNIKYAMYYLLFNFDKDVMKGMQKSSMPYIKLELLQKADIYYNEGAIDKTVEVLEKLDEEISLQKEKLEKIKIQRKAMQQYLLTGIVRVG